MSDREAFEKFEKWCNANTDYTYWECWQAAQAQASKPIAAVHGWFHGECVIRPLDPEAVLPAGMVLYSQPQAQAVNQQLLAFDAYSTEGDYWMDSPADSEFVGSLSVGDEYELLASIRAVPVRFRVVKAPDENSDDYEVVRVDDAIAAAQEQSK